MSLAFLESALVSGRERDNHRLGEILKYRMAWKHLDTGLIVKGELLFHCRHSAEYAARALNQVWPGIHHWAEEADEGTF